MFFYLLFGFSLMMVSIVFFLVSLVCCLVARRKNREIAAPELCKPLATRRTLLIVSSTIMGVLPAITLSLMVLLYFAIAYM